ncbi:hypothetical protein ACTXJ9_15765 [Brachybacterium tyrofermentans]|uniref:hypothetical protein n=1 Tax=Brachybacterium tyrofermentans TaxID=47848 RepID=UPI003FD51B5C
MTRRRWLLFGAAALAMVLVLVIGVLSLRQLTPGSAPGAAPENRASSASTTPPPPPAWESTQLPGYDSDPGLLALTPLADATGDPVTASLALEPGALRTGGTVGLSFDARELANPIWDSETSNLTLTLSELDRPVLRFGGNGVDRHMWWTSSGEPAPDWAQVTVTPDDLERVAAVADDVDAQVTIVLDLGHDDPARAADMAANAQKAFGERLIAVTIGNEPNGYFHPNQPQLAVRGENWGPEPYQKSLREHSAALEEAAPGLPVAGPGAYDAPWWRAFAEAGIPNQRALTMHWYPLWDCEGPASSIANPTVEDLTSPALRERAHQIVGMGAEIADAHDLPLWMEETGPTSCPGTNDTSRTHAQALWTADYVMTLMELGVERAAFHATLRACQGGAPMSPVCATGSVEKPGEIVSGRTSYLALMILGWMPDGQVLSPSVSGDGAVMVHGVIAEDESLTLAVVDMRDPARADAAPVEISAPSGFPADTNMSMSWELSEGATLTGKALEAPESLLTAPAEITGEFAGAPLGHTQPLMIASDPGSVTVLTLDPVRDAGPSDGGS